MWPTRVRRVVGHLISARLLMTDPFTVGHRRQLRPVHDLLARLFDRSIRDRSDDRSIDRNRTEICTFTPPCGGAAAVLLTTQQVRVVIMADSKPAFVSSPFA